jgi:hypothetical protein
MKKNRTIQIENALQSAFLADSPLLSEPPRWRGDTMRAVFNAAAAEERNHGFRLFSRRQERVLWRSAWAALAAVTLICTVYFSLNNDALDADLASFAIVDLEGY